MNCWHIYEMLKKLIIPTKDDITEIKEMEAEEVKEGLIQWFYVLSEDNYYQSRKGFKFKEIPSGKCYNMKELGDMAIKTYYSKSEQ